MNKNSLKILVIGLVIILFVVFKLPTKIDQEITLAKVVYGIPEEASAVNLHLSGYKYRYLFRPNEFTGSVVLGETEFTKVRFRLAEFNVLAGIYDSSGDTKSIGQIFATNSLEEITILVFENQTWSIRDSIFLTGPANSRDEAVQLINRHLSSDRIMRNETFE